MDKQKELIPRTPEAEEEHQKFLKRCRGTLFLMNSIKCLVDAWLASNGEDTEKLSLGIANVVEPIILTKIREVVEGTRLTATEISLALNRAGLTDEVHQEHEVVAEAQIKATLKALGGE